jgi:hypothetical protein
MKTNRPRQTARLNTKLDKGLFAYVVAASAAGVGALALTPQAEGKVVYTPTHVMLTSTPNPSTYSLDLNHDGIKDFFLSDWLTGDFSIVDVGLSCDPVAASNMVWGPDFRSALPHGVKVGPSGSWNRKFPRMGSAAYVGTVMRYYSYGYWVDGGKGVKDRYLGLKFAINGKIHYGWARLNVSVQHRSLNIRATLTGYAYETVPNKAIITGRTKGPDVVVERTTLGRLARGASDHSHIESRR